MAGAIVAAFAGFILLALPSIGVCGYPWPDNVTQHRGYIEVNQTYGVNLFYWFFESRGNPATDPLVVWLTGGPGCSSELGMLMENGPFLIMGSDVPVYNPNGWNSFANVLYIDNPGGTGFSYVKNSQGYVTDERTIANELWDLIRAFYGLYPKYANLKLYITGESYAGHYVPALGQVIVESNSPYAKNLQGLAIGNGWVDPLIQYQSYAQFALENNLITQAQFNQAQQLYGPCQSAIQNGDWTTAYGRCSALEGFVLETAERNLGRSINPYDIRLTCPGGGLCYDITNITKFLNRADVQADLGVSRTWEACDNTVLDHLIDDWVQNFANATATVLLHGKTVVVYSGKEDFVCDYVGGAEWTNATVWPGQADFQKEGMHDWVLGGQVVGEAKSADGFIFVAVEAAGHLVPMNQPQVALSLLEHLVKNEPFY
ncbi:hypothetical protein EMCRGX_G021002 [Ephydatia muelleri]